jgi:hypothetical protein
MRRNNVKKYFFSSLALILLMSLITGCSISPDNSQQAASQNNGSSLTTGKLEIKVTDAPRSDNVSQIWIKVSEIRVHEAGTNQNDNDDGKWISANITGPNPFDLMTLKNGGIQQVLGNATLTSGNYTQIRLVVDSVRVMVNGEMKNAEIPSGNLKFIHPFEIQGGQVTTLLFDFDAAKSVNVTPNKIIVKPVVKLSSDKPAFQSPANDLKISTINLPAAQTGQPYNFTFQATGGATPYIWTASGNLTPGLILIADNGILTGSPVSAGNFTFNVIVTDNNSRQDTRTFNMTVN